MYACTGRDVLILYVLSGCFLGNAGFFETNLPLSSLKSSLFLDLY